ncbi:ABC transporter ATP-binding protein [Pandoraea nosoerga]|uniref:ABC transporter ATP-binding protein n=1 Tax=Pandoraea nosoerga TaxID=2508296 RepID=A0A5E4TQ38_9BURK|nr:ABC transporter ATP-binding protein [Pandoraea nosoerga]MBN4665536.1 ABC transporter ATP-binding protein [Pandoraea nosoerga]MBN4675061.1 ABC transporter ATP-binding protein [Pandoraea nosoerga]MBN4680377.1 ABC transporter ATP-binding protein [Pandoraea nosoerga]MBN4745545.1 ABC transporter ATP-binding protein [Pandoraea nosoerga]VVD88219.1 ABC transporter ATP-binding protein [Pandoraea nosoerga]
MPLPYLLLDHISVNYAAAGHAHTAVRDLSLSLARGEIGCLLGPSGCGKTTVLRAVCGFEPLAGGRIVLDGHEVANARSSEPPERRHVGVVFQDYALFPHLSVAGNIAFGLGRMARAEREARVATLAERVGLAGALHKYPHELSGGQQQRVALARALAPSPALLLLDEPFSNLDLDLRERLAVEVREIIRASGATAILVTHDQHEAFAMADRIGVMHAGAIAQWSPARELWRAPANRVVADFVGRGAFIPGTFRGNAGGGGIALELGEIAVSPALAEQLLRAAGDAYPVDVDVLLRADDIAHDPASPFEALLVRRAFRGADQLYTLRLASGREVLARVDGDLSHEAGERVGLRLAVQHPVAFVATRAASGAPGVMGATTEATAEATAEATTETTTETTAA